MTVDFDSFFWLVSESPGHEGVPEITPEAIKRRQCACCGRPAKVSFHSSCASPVKRSLGW